MYSKLRIVYFLERFLKYNLKNPLFYFVIIDWALTQYILKTWIGFEYNPVVKYLWNDLALLVSIVLVSLVPKWVIRYILIGWYSFIIIRHIFIILWVI